MNLFKYYHHVKVTLEVFDPCFTLSKIKKHKITIYKFKKISDYRYSFITNNKNINKLKELFKSIKIENRIGIINIFIKNILRISTVISIILSILLFSFMNTLIMDINIKGDSSSLISIIDDKLKENNIKKHSKRKTNDELLKIEKEISIELYDLIEWIEIKNQGLKVNVNFLKRRESFKIKNSKKAIYSTKEGIIKSFNIEKGVKKVNINDYVVSGQLLIDGYINDSKNNLIFIGAIGSVYAYTWININVSMPVDNYDEATLYLILNERVNAQVDKKLTGDDEYIDTSHLLKFEIKNNMAYLNMHYTLVEDITR